MNNSPSIPRGSSQRMTSCLGGGGKPKYSTGNFLSGIERGYEVTHQAYLRGVDFGAHHNQRQLTTQPEGARLHQTSRVEIEDLPYEGERYMLQPVPLTPELC